MNPFWVHMNLKIWQLKKELSLVGCQKQISNWFIVTSHHYFSSSFLSFIESKKIITMGSTGATISRSLYVNRLRRAFILRCHPDQFRQHSDAIRKQQSVLLQVRSVIEKIRLVGS